MVNYKFKSPHVRDLVSRLNAVDWSVEKDLPWDEPVNPERFLLKPPPSLLSEMPEFKKLTPIQQARLSNQEVIYFLSNQVACEFRAIRIIGSIIANCPDDSPDWQVFSCLALRDEDKHNQALGRYMRKKIQILYQPPVWLERLLDQMVAVSDYKLATVLGQTCLEWSSVNFMSTLLIKSPEPLLREMLLRILADEGRHLAFNNITFGDTGEHWELDRECEDLIFESSVAFLGAAFAIPVWKEYGFSRTSCVEYAKRQLSGQNGLMAFYKKVLPQALRRYGIQSDRLENLLKEELFSRITDFHWTYEPRLEQQVPEAPL